MVYVKQPTPAAPVVSEPCQEGFHLDLQHVAEKPSGVLAPAESRAPLCPSRSSSDAEQAYASGGEGVLSSIRKDVARIAGMSPLGIAAKKAANGEWELPLALATGYVTKGKGAGQAALPLTSEFAALNKQANNLVAQGHFAKADLFELQIFKKLLHHESKVFENGHIATAPLGAAVRWIEGLIKKDQLHADIGQPLISAIQSVERAAGEINRALHGH